MRYLAALAASLSALTLAQVPPNGVVEVPNRQWVVSVRVEQDRPDRPEAGLALRMASTIAVSKIIEFACTLKPGAGETVTARLKGLSTIGSRNTAEWAEVTLAAPLQPLDCKLRKAVQGRTEQGDDMPPAPVSGGPVVREVRTEY